MGFVLLSQENNVLVSLHPNQMPLSFSCQKFESIPQKSAVLNELIYIKLSFKSFFSFQVNVLVIANCESFRALAHLGKQIFYPFRFIIRFDFLSCFDSFVGIFKEYVNR
jgi:hypothetical protein